MRMTKMQGQALQVNAFGANDCRERLRYPQLNVYIKKACPSRPVERRCRTGFCRFKTYSGILTPQGEVV